VRVLFLFGRCRCQQPPDDETACFYPATQAFTISSAQNPLRRLCEVDLPKARSAQRGPCDRAMAKCELLHIHRLVRMLRAG
jgi:hypothetical protein